MSWSKLIVANLSAAGPAAVAELARRMGMPTPRMSVCIRRLHKEQRAVHVVAWQGAQRAVYAAGEGRDKPRPAPLTVAQRCRTYRSDPVIRLNRIMSDRARRARKRVPPPQSWLSSLQ